MSEHLPTVLLIQVLAVRFVREPDERPSGLAFAEFASKEECLKVRGMIPDQDRILPFTVETSLLHRESRIARLSVHGRDRGCVHASFPRATSPGEYNMCRSKEKSSAATQKQSMMNSTHPLKYHVHGNISWGAFDFGLSCPRCIPHRNNTHPRLNTHKHTQLCDFLWLQHSCVIQACLR